MALLVVLGFSAAIYSSNLESLSEGSSASAALVSASQVSNAIDSVVISGDSSSAEFFFKTTEDLNASVIGNLLIVKHANGVVEAELHSSNIDFSGFGFNKRLKISNFSGMVVVESAE